VARQSGSVAGFKVSTVIQTETALMFKVLELETRVIQIDGRGTGCNTVNVTLIVRVYKKA